MLDWVPGSGDPAPRDAGPVSQDQGPVEIRLENVRNLERRNRKLQAEKRNKYW